MWPLRYGPPGTCILNRSSQPCDCVIVEDHVYQEQRDVKPHDRLVLVSYGPHEPSHTQPIKLVVYKWSLGGITPRRAYLEARFSLRCFQRLSGTGPSYPAVPLAGQPAHQRSVLPNPLVLGEALLKSPPPTADRDRPVSRRSEPSSRTAFIGEQPNPWDLLQPQDAMSRHRGAKPPRRCGRSGGDQPVIPGVPFIR